MADTRALATLLGLQSPSNMTATASPYFNKRRSQIVSGEETLAPSDLETMQAQLELGNQGLGVSRDMIRDAGISSLRQRLGLAAAQEAAKTGDLTAVERVKGQYAVQAAAEAAKAAEARRSANAEDIAARQETSSQAAMDRLTAAMGGRKELQEGQQAFTAGRVSSTGLSAIARERQHLADVVAKEEPGTLAKFIGRTNPRQQELDAFDDTLSLAHKIAAQFPDASAEEGLAQLGETGMTPAEVGQTQKFLLLLRGR